MGNKRFDYNAIKHILEKDYLIKMDDKLEYGNLEEIRKVYNNKTCNDEEKQKNNLEIINNIWNEVITSCSAYLKNIFCIEGESVFWKYDIHNIEKVYEMKYFECMKYNSILGVVYDILQEKYSETKNNLLYHYIILYAGKIENNYQTDHVRFDREDYLEKEKELIIRKNELNIKLNEEDMICYRKNYQDTWYYKFRKEISDYITEEPIYFKELVSHSKKCLHEFDNEVLGEIFFRYEDLYKKIKKNRKKDCSRQIEEEIIRIKDFFSKKYGFSKEKGYYDISDKLDKEKFTIKLITELQLERYLKADLTIAIFSALEEYKTLGLDINNEFINALCDIDGLYVGSPVLLSMSVLHMYNAVQKNRNTKIIASYFDSIHTQYIEALFETVEVTIPILKCYIRSQLFFFLNKGILKNNNAEDKYDEIDNLIIDILLDYIIMSMDKIKIINQMPNMIIFPEGKESRLDGRQDITDYVKEVTVNTKLKYDSLYNNYWKNTDIKNKYGQKVYNGIFSKGCMEKRHRQDNLEEYLNIAEERIITHEAMKQLAECNIKALLQKNL